MTVVVDTSVAVKWFVREGTAPSERSGWLMRPTAMLPI